MVSLVFPGELMPLTHMHWKRYQDTGTRDEPVDAHLRLASHLHRLARTPLRDFMILVRLNSEVCELVP